MSERTVSLLLEDIRDSLKNIEDFTIGMTVELYRSDLKTQHAVERNFEIIGEAVARLPTAYKDLHPHIEWRIMKDFRNFMVHEYFGIDHQIVWDTILYKLPDLFVKIVLLLKRVNKY